MSRLGGKQQQHYTSGNKKHIHQPNNGELTIETRIAEKEELEEEEEETDFIEQQPATEVTNEADSSDAVNTDELMQKTFAQPRGGVQKNNQTKHQ